MQLTSCPRLRASCKTVCTFICIVHLTAHQLIGVSSNKSGHPLACQSRPVTLVRQLPICGLRCKNGLTFRAVTERKCCMRTLSGYRNRPFGECRLYFLCCLCCGGARYR